MPGTILERGTVDGTSYRVWRAPGYQGKVIIYFGNKSNKAGLGKRRNKKWLKKMKKQGRVVVL